MRELKFRAWNKEKINVREGCKGMYKQNGYVMAKAEYHPYANKRGYVPLHRLIVENELGRYLEPRKELVHHIDGNRSNNDFKNLKLTTPKEHFMEEHFEARNNNGRFAASDPIFQEIKYRLYDRDKGITQIYSLQELISKTYRRAKFEFRGRYTGLKDKNGTEIYEGDIIRDRRADRRWQEHVGDAIPGGYYKEPLEPIINEDVYHVHFEQGCFVFGKDYEVREFPNPLAFAVEDESDMDTMINYFNMPNNEQAQNEDFDYLLEEYNLQSIEELQQYIGAEVIGNVFENEDLLKEDS